jgi:MFS family permease
MCDWIGRKKIILTGFVSLGLAYALIGFLPYFEPVWHLYFIVDGVAWGIFLLVFFVILWGDIAKSHRSEKYYIIGSIPFFLSNIIPQIVTTSFIEGIGGFTAAFSVASFFLFIAVIPLVFAPETLPEKKMELRRLRSFAEEAQKAKEKYEIKSAK